MAPMPVVVVVPVPPVAPEPACPPPPTPAMPPASRPQLAAHRAVAASAAAPSQRIGVGAPELARPCCPSVMTPCYRQAGSDARLVHAPKAAALHAPSGCDGPTELEESLLRIIPWLVTLLCVGCGAPPLPAPPPSGTPAHERPVAIAGSAGPALAASASPPSAAAAVAPEPAPAICGPAVIAQGHWCERFVGPWSNVKQAAVTVEARCVLLDTGAVWCSGTFDLDGDDITTAEPRRLTKLDGAQAIAAHFRDVYGLRGDGSLVCSGRFCHDEGLERIAGFRPRSITVNRAQRCLASFDGRVACEPRHGSISFELIPSLSGAARLAVASNLVGRTEDVCAQTREGSVQCEGSFRSPKDATAVALGDDFACFVVKGQVRCEGPNAAHHLRLRSPATPAAPIPVSIDGAVTLWALDEEACAQTAAGDVWCWGGGIRNNASCAVEGPDYVCPPRRIAILKGATDIAMGPIMGVCGVVGGRLACGRWQ
jgi:hypothetical protein